MDKVEFHPMTGMATADPVWHVYQGDYFRGSIHLMSDGWYWGSFHHDAGPFETPRLAAIYARDYLLGRIQRVGHD